MSGSEITGLEFARLVGQAEEELAPGVLGVVCDRVDGFWLLVIRAEQPGSGAVGRYLDTLPRDRPVKVPCVVSFRLAEMLERRGFRRADPMLSHDPDLWQRYPG